MVTWTKAAQGAIIVVLLLYCFLEAQRALRPSPPAAGGRDAQKLGFVDYDALAKDADSAKSVPGVANGNWHYQCFLHWKNIPDHQMPTPATYQGVGEIYSLEDGTCTDDMNRGVLKVILHEVCAAKE